MLPVDEKRILSRRNLTWQHGRAAPCFSAREPYFLRLSTHVQPSHSDQVLDVGVSDVVNDGANVLERSYPHQE